MQGHEAIRPHAETAWKHASNAHQVAYAKGAEWYETGSKKGQELWNDAGPMLHKTHTSLKAGSFPTMPHTWLSHGRFCLFLDLIKTDLGK